MHGIVSLELAHTATPPPAGFPDAAATTATTGAGGEVVLLKGLRATLTGLRAPASDAP